MSEIYFVIEIFMNFGNSGSEYLRVKGLKVQSVNNIFIQSILKSQL